MARLSINFLVNLIENHSKLITYSGPTPLIILPGHAHISRCQISQTNLRSSANSSAETKGSASSSTSR